MRDASDGRWIGTEAKPRTVLVHGHALNGMDAGVRGARVRADLRYDVMAIVDQLLAKPGLYVGKDTARRSDVVSTARIVVSPLPGRAGVSLDYEVLNGVSPAPGLGHVEHTLIGRADDGSTIMVIAHTHGQGIAILRETEPGVFEPGDIPSPYPIKVVVSVPEPGRLRHAWWYGSPGEAAVEQDVAELELVTD